MGNKESMFFLQLAELGIPANRRRAERPNTSP
jgi:hypothetical protein